jgi:hypothetical protein
LKRVLVENGAHSDVKKAYRDIGREVDKTEIEVAEIVGLLSEGYFKG